MRESEESAVCFSIDMAIENREYRDKGLREIIVNALDDVIQDHGNYENEEIDSWIEYAELVLHGQLIMDF